MKQFILNYQGNKYKETKHINHLDYSKYDCIVECFGGSFGFIRYLYDNNYTDKQYIVVDNNKELIDFYKYLQTTDIDDFLRQYNEYNDIIFERFKHDNKQQIKTKDTKAWIDENVKNPHMLFLLKHNLFLNRVSRTSKKTNFTYGELVKKITFIHAEIKDFDFNQYNKEKTLFYLDPPYVFECNSFYKNIEAMRHIFEKIIYLFENKYNTILIHSYNFLVDYILTRPYISKLEYGMMYSNTNNKRQHIVYYHLC
jgi:site-specific DNA-adenine methylase